ncbi:hypothetical protein PM082_004269 [Marasmius tenuissimus]|nr:hypothetical protein PM082_004269 [Marasmius tenuissimus]
MMRVKHFTMLLSTFQRFQASESTLCFSFLHDPFWNMTSDSDVVSPVLTDRRYIYTVHFRVVCRLYILTFCFPFYHDSSHTIHFDISFPIHLGLRDFALCLGFRTVYTFSPTLDSLLILHNLIKINLVSVLSHSSHSVSLSLSLLSLYLPFPSGQGQLNSTVSLAKPSTIVQPSIQPSSCRNLSLTPTSHSNVGLRLFRLDFCLGCHICMILTTDCCDLSGPSMMVIDYLAKDVDFSDSSRHVPTKFMSEVQVCLGTQMDWYCYKVLGVYLRQQRWRAVIMNLERSSRLNSDRDKAETGPNDKRES